MKISVCMATYNGGKYIERQLDSILVQLSADDEVIVVDDASSDNTADIITARNDPRIKLSRNPTNIGVLKNFENAIRRASGDLIFLSDQDDLWLEDKVSSILDAFSSNPQVTLVFGNAELMNAEGQSLGRNFWSRRLSAGLISNLVKNQFLGCTLAFRRGLCDWALPFPVDIPMHDMWLGLVNALYGKSLYLEKPLIRYRMHPQSATYGTITARGRVAFLKKAYWRYSLIKNLIARYKHIKKMRKSCAKLTG
ncbi:MAG: glycosyltransferase family 2 protein [Planctomycetota bacterium]